MGGGSQTSTTNTSPWSGQQPYLTDLFQQAQGLFRGGPQQFYPGNLVAGFSPQTELGLDMSTARAMGGAPYEGAFQNYLTGTLGRGNLDPYSIAAGGYGAAQGIQPGMQMMHGAGYGGPSWGDASGMVGVGSDIGLPGASQFAGGVVGPYAQALQGMSGFGSLGEASQFAGTPAPGALPASNSFVSRALGNTDPNFMRTLQQTQGAIGGPFSGSNPYLDSVYQNASDRITTDFNEQVMPGLNATFGAAGRSGSGSHALMSGRAAGDVAGQLRGLAGDIYMPAYENQQNRMLQGNIAGGQIASDVYGRDLGQQLGAAQLGGDLFSRMNEAELGRGGLASNLYLGTRGLGQDAATAAGQLGLGGGDLAARLYGTGTQSELSRLGLAGNLYGGGLDRMLAAGQGLGQLGLGGLESLGGLYDVTGTQQFRAGSLAPSAQQMDYANIDRMLQSGALTEDQAQRLIDAEMQRHAFGQNAPWQNLGNYANAVYGLPGGYGSQTSSGGGGSRLAGALGGAMSGYQMFGGSPWGAIGGGLLGGLLS